LMLLKEGGTDVMRIRILCVALLALLLISSAHSQKEDIRATGTEELPKSIIGKDGAKMTLIPAGEFQMGTDPAEIPELVRWAKESGLGNANASWFEDESPRHTVYLGAFYMDKYEVTNAQYRAFVQATGHKEPEGFGLVKAEGGNYTVVSGFKPWSDESYNGDNQPVVCVTWSDARAYAEWAGKRLPTEAEWEKAAREGLVGKRFSWGDDWPPPPEAGNFADAAFKAAFPDATYFIPGYDDGYAYTAPAGSFAPNGYGLHDMAGNVWEWCADWYDSGYYAKSPRENPEGPNSGTSRVLRGGSWYGYLLRCANRSYLNPTYAYNYIGFRCAQ
jgi:formylglycine-generating enzyme required for sulfatase activity